MSETVLETASLVSGYVPEVAILNGVDLTLRRGEIMTLVGPNGAGKSTLLKTVFGYLRPRSGRILLRGAEIGGMAPHAIARRGVGYVPQLANVFTTMSVEENLEMGAVARPGVDLRERRARIYELFPRLAERRRQLAGTMSGGERQMTAMARALMAEPEILLLDEPSAGLAPAFVDRAFAQVERINRAGVTILMVEQNARRALALSHRGYVLDLGRTRYEGSGAALLGDPRVGELYLGSRREAGS